MFTALLNNLKANRRTIVFTEGPDARIQEAAARLLRETDEKTYRVAERTGYADPNYFSYVFKKQFGLSPSKFRAGLKN